MRGTHASCDSTEAIVRDGEDGYDRLVAILEVLTVRDGQEVDPWQLRGFIIDGELPRPEDASTK